MELKDLKVGMKFKVVDKKVGEKWNEACKMDKWLGKIMTVRNIFLAFEAIKADEDIDEHIGDGWTWHSHMIDWEATAKLNKQHNLPRILVNGNATIVWFEDGEKVVVKHTDDNEFDLEKAVAMACAKKLLGGYGKFKELMDVAEVKSKDNKQYAIVVQVGQTYTTYVNFFKENNIEHYSKDYPNYHGNLNWNGESNIHPYNGEKVEVLEHFEHRDGSNVIYVVRKSNGKIGLIGKDGLKFL